MSAVWVFSAYGAAFVLALILLYLFPARWYWHALSVAVAIAIGLIRFPQGLQPPDLVLGSVFVLLFFWGVGAPFVRPRGHGSRAPRHA